MMKITIKEYVDGMLKDKTGGLRKYNMLFGLTEKLIQIEAINRHFELMLGVELEIKVKPINPIASQFIGDEIITSLQKEINEKKT